MSDDKLSKTFTITQLNGTQHTVIVDADRYDEVTQYNWCVRATNGKIYVRRTLFNGGNQTTQYLHHFIAGNRPAGMVIDHASSNTLDNRRCNLRICTLQENLFNRGERSGKPSGLKGVKFDLKSIDRPWIAETTLNKKSINLGSYKTSREAFAAYCAFARQHHGEFFNPGTPDFSKADELQKLADATKHDKVTQKWAGMRGIKRIDGSKINPWQVAFVINKVRYYLGLHPTITAAQQARDEFLSQHTEARQS